MFIIDEFGRDNDFLRVKKPFLVIGIASVYLKTLRFGMPFDYRLYDFFFMNITILIFFIWILNLFIRHILWNVNRRKAVRFWMEDTVTRTKCLNLCTLLTLLEWRFVLFRFIISVHGICSLGTRNSKAIVGGGRYFKSYHLEDSSDIRTSPVSVGYDRTFFMF